MEGAKGIPNLPKKRKACNLFGWSAYSKSDRIPYEEITMPFVPSENRAISIAISMTKLKRELKEAYFEYYHFSW